MRRGLLGLGLAISLVACSGDDSSDGGGTGGSATGGTSGAGGGATGGTSGAGGSATGGTGGGATGGTGGSATGGTGGSATGGTGGSATGGTGGSATGGTGGSATGGTGGSATGGTGGSATGGTGGGGGQACTWGTTKCPTGQYCESSTCGAGTCVAIPKETNGKTPVCGCDGVTYWNVTVAANNQASVKGSGACSAGGKTCGGLAGLPCPTGTFCNYGVNSAVMCGVSDLGGTCWGLPQQCPTLGFGPNTRACKAATCTGECTLIKTGKTWYVDNTCPQ